MEKTAQSVFYKIAFSILIVVIGFFLAQYVIKLNELQRDIAQLHIQITKLQGKFIDREQIKSLIKDYHDNHPCYRCRQTN